MGLPVLRARMLGPMDLRFGERQLTPLDSGRAESLLAYLLLHRDAPQPTRLTCSGSTRTSGPASPAGLTGNRHDLEVPATDGAFEGADDLAVVVVGPEHVQRLAVLAERDDTRPGP